MNPGYLWSQQSISPDQGDVCPSILNAPHTIWKPPRRSFYILGTKVVASLPPFFGDAFGNSALYQRPLGYDMGSPFAAKAQRPRSARCRRYKRTLLSAPLRSHPRPVRRIFEVAMDMHGCNTKR